ncbi:hypothetical protein FHT08_002721 [Xanthomonas campestris]|nr:hypothetical protein [Xanthomonas sp. CFBP 8151]
MGNGEWGIATAALRGKRESTNQVFTIPDSRFPNPVTQAARLSDSVSDSMLAALGLTSQNLPM